MPDIDDDDFSFFQRRILSLSGIHLSSMKKDLVRARLIARLTDLGLPTIKAYRQYLGTLSSHDSEWQQLINQITTNKTDFFREPAHFKFLLETFLPKWNARNPGGKLRVWSAACSTGEEPYTLAMVLNRYFHDDSRFEILASDIDTEVLEKAKNGVYPINRLPEIPFEYHASGFVKGKGDVQKWFKIKNNLQARIKFTRINLVELEQDDVGHFDLIFCRNVFIYFKPETIQEIIGSFNRALNSYGALILGHSESLNVDQKRWKPFGSSIYFKESAGLKSTGTKSEKITVTAPKLVNQKKKVLIVDDSLTIRQLLSTALAQSDRLQVVAAIGDPRDVESAILRFRPDVITLDLKMPHLDGCQLLEQILPKFSIPVVIISAVSREEGPLVLQALELGAVDYIQKPTLQDLKTSASTLVDIVSQAADAHVHRQKKHVQADRTLKKRSVSLIIGKQVIVAIGSSTGGIQALTEILTQMPDSIPPILIVQHIPQAFSRAFAERLNTLCAFHVKEAEDGDLVYNDQVLIAPGGLHMELESSPKGFRVKLQDGPAVNRHKPSVDVLFESVARLLGSQAIGIILTGMGQDGAKGLKAMKDTGALTIAQDEATSAVYGMPREAVRLRAVDHVLPLDKIPQSLLRFLQDKKGPKRA
nr:chemotaxis-specific protein-glutamate methyltransferase CheB [Oligoflexus tunisiensis]